DGVQEVNIENGAIHVTYNPLRTTEKKIEESIRASGNSVTSAETDSETPGPVTAPGLAATREQTTREQTLSKRSGRGPKPQSASAATTAVAAATASKANLHAS